MILSDRDIKKALENGTIRIAPELDFTSQLGSCSVDFRLGNVFRVFERNGTQDSKKEKPLIVYTSKKDYTNEITREVDVKDGEQFIVNPGDFVLAVTLERLTLPDNIMGRLEGRSSLGRLGIVVHSTASVFEPGWDGKCVLELGNLGNMAVALTPGMRICAMTFEELSSPAEIPYNKKKTAKYIIQEGPEESRIHEDK